MRSSPDAHWRFGCLADKAPAMWRQFYRVTWIPRVCRAPSLRGVSSFLFALPALSGLLSYFLHCRAIRGLYLANEAPVSVGRYWIVHFLHSIDEESDGFSPIADART